MNRIIDIKRTETNVTEPLTLTEVKNHLHITDTDNDTKLTDLITVCRRAAEFFCSISIVNYRITLFAWLEHEWELPWGPVTGIESVATRTGTEGSGPPTYETETSGWEQDGEEFMSFTPSIDNRYKIVYTAGFQSVPDDLKEGILHELSFRYEHRGDELDEKTICSPSAKNILFNYKRMTWL